MYINEAWLAGFIEGDGCFSVNSQRSGKYVYPKIEIHQKNLEPLEAIRDKFGMGLYRGRLGVCSVTGSPARELFGKIAPYLSSKRIDQAKSKGFLYEKESFAHNLDWFAGYYEAEGCIHTKTNGQFRKDGTQKHFVAMTISQYYSDETSVLCLNVLKKGRVAGPYMSRGQRRAYSFSLSGIDAINTIRSIEYMLSQEKINQLEEVLKKIG